MDDPKPAPPAEPWSAPCGAGAKRVLVAFLVLCFLGQSYLVYSDPPPGPALNERALAGRRLWHAKNCQACHQLYGMGGFLGPDLTNATERVNVFRLRKILKDGSGAMPAFGLEKDDVRAVSAFLAAMNASGRGQVRQWSGWDTLDPDARATEELTKAVSEQDQADVSVGFGIFSVRCRICHAPLRVGNTGAPDLGTVFSRNDAAEVRRVLAEGRPPKMPNAGLTAEEQRSVFAFLQWFDGARDGIAAASGADREKPGLLSNLPWWEFK